MAHGRKRFQSPDHVWIDDPYMQDVTPETGCSIHYWPSLTDPDSEDMDDVETDESGVEQSVDDDTEAEEEADGQEGQKGNGKEKDRKDKEKDKNDKKTKKDEE